jgi:DNA repair exonuclease SbcCD ATPase subunit
MTRFDPSLRLSRLTVFKGGKPVYDERFHLGVNIIRGKNSTGKSTIADLIFYALGGESIAWREEAASCDFVFAEVVINGTPVTLRREISRQKERPMQIYWGDYEAASSSAGPGWESYPYSQRGDKQSFSQVLFRSLEIPQARGELASRITMHQVLRLVYSDQRTAPDEIFRNEDFDSKLVRDAIGALLCGFYDEKLYDAETRAQQLRSEQENINGQLNQLGRFLGDQDIGLELFDDTLKLKMRERDELYDKLKNQRVEQLVGSAPDKEVSRKVSELEKQLQETSIEIVKLEQSLSELDFEIADSEQFIKAVEGKSEALEESVLTREALGEIFFESCPACHQQVVPPENAKLCPLCKAERPEASVGSQLLRFRQELSLQVTESQKLQAERRESRNRIAARLPVLYTKRTELQLRHADLATRPSPPQEAIVHDAYRRIGYLDREIEDIQKRIQMANTYRALSERKAQLVAELSRLEDEISERQSHRERREAEAKSEIIKTTAALLESDLKREKGFTQVESVQFSFAANKIEINGRANYSASSTVVIKNAFHLALLLSSTRKAFFRYLRIALFDNIEDKGMEEVRSRNFQKLIVEASKDTEVEHQVIFTTSMIDPSLDTPEFVVGDFYTEENKSLKMPAKI